MNPRLYILMRNDLPSLNPGKAMAQAAHAANHFIFLAEALDISHPDLRYIDHWRVQTPQGFGTTITLATGKEEMLETVAMAHHIGLLAGVVHDPTYPVADGPERYYVPMDTCAWVFLPQPGLRCGPLSKMQLHP